MEKLDAYELNRLRTKALIEAELITAKELGRVLLPNHPEHEAHCRVNEWLRKQAKPRDPSIALAWIAFTDSKWPKRGKVAAAANQALEQLTNPQ